MDNTPTPVVEAETLVLVTGNSPAAEPVKPARKSRVKATPATTETPSNVTRRPDGLTVTDH